MRDIKADMKAALIEEHAGYVRASRKADAEHVAATLKDGYDYDVDAHTGASEPGKRPEPGGKETTAAAAPPEAAVEPKAPAKKAASGRRQAAKSAETKPTQD